MSKLLGLADIRDWIKSLNYTASENCYIGKLDRQVYWRISIKNQQ